MKSHHVQTADLKASLYWVTLRGITLNNIGLQRAHRNMIFDTTDLANIEPFRYIT